MVVQPVEVLAGSGFKFVNGVVDLLHRKTVHLSAVNSVAHANGDSLHRLTQIFLIFLQVRRLSIQLQKQTKIFY